MLTAAATIKITNQNTKIQFMCLFKTNVLFTPDTEIYEQTGIMQLPGIFPGGSKGEWVSGLSFRKVGMVLIPVFSLASPLKSPPATLIQQYSLFIYFNLKHTNIHKTIIIVSHSKYQLQSRKFKRKSNKKNSEMLYKLKPFSLSVSTLMSSLKINHFHIYSFIIANINRKHRINN